MGQIKDETGHSYGELTVIRLATPEEKAKYATRHAIWYCQCSCGNSCLVNGYDLRSGKQKSCGCLKTKRIITQNQNNYKDLTNQKFTHLIALYPIEKRAQGGNYIWHCRCDCGNEIDVIGARLTGGYTTSCGCHYQRRASQYSIKIREILQANNVPYEEEYYISYGNKHYGFFDFYLPTYNIALEVQGIQHYDTTSPWYRPEYDERKKEYCRNNNIRLIEIPYWDIDQYSFQYLLEKMEINN